VREETVITHSKLKPILVLEFCGVVSASTDQTSTLRRRLIPFLEKDSDNPPAPFLTLFSFGLVGFFHKSSG